MTDDTDATAFTDFLRSREAASTAFVEGEVEPLLALSACADPATLYPPYGTMTVGSDEVNRRNTESATGFLAGAENRFEVLHADSSGDLGYWTGIQHSQLRLADSAEPVRMNLRVTELFRRVDGRWLLFHRHADPWRP